MMNFRTVNQAIITILGNAAASRFKVVGFEGQGKDASEILNSNRTVQSYYSTGDFPKSRGRQTGTTQHAMKFSVGLAVSAKSKVNLSVINNPQSTTGQIAAAMTAMQEAAFVADGLFDELAEIVYQILMDGRNFDLGLSVGTISDRWVDSIKKDAPEPNGELVVLTGTVEYSCNTAEEITGDIGVLATGGFDTQLDIYGDDVERTGIKVADDRTKPVISAFVIPSISDSFTIPVITFTATDNNAVAGWKITESATPPTTWGQVQPVVYVAATDGEHTLYAWVRDAEGNVSTPATATVTITIP